MYYYAALHYIDAFLVMNARKTWNTHGERLLAMGGRPETHAIETAYQRLEKASREARYEGTPFTAADVERNIRPLYESIRRTMRSALGLPL